jgi:type II secretory pathway pseudopilin PulG
VKARHALTLVELIVVLCVIAAISGIVIPVCSDQMASATRVTTLSTLSEVQQTLQSYWQDTKLIELDGLSTYSTEADRFEIKWLFKNPVTNDATNQFSPVTRIGWNGPYLLSSTDSGATPGLIDAWNSSLVVQYVNPASSGAKDVRVVSPGPNGVVEINPTASTSSLTAGSIGDDLYVALTLR